MTDIGLFEAIYSARSLRRLKPDPVPEEIITRILDAAIRAPSAGNAQNWTFLVIRDAEQRQRLGAIYRRASEIAAAVYNARPRPVHLSEAQWQQMMSSGTQPESCAPIVRMMRVKRLVCLSASHPECSPQTILASLHITAATPPMTFAW